ncbi:T9SS type A sorting domain-containing protein [Microvirga sp. STS02]|uniref:T9SS type A sorting domain-containing protein n=1 Tax=Hymenobacter negativus TaxID=2795026 RepID=UPI0018DD4827|nr:MULTISPECIES: T9SS type A sorting domain-containing protein [Bacteria]MBH8570866.1 T9SS type A sorting domain-containing protein [Hymenobacter negativus]MBR7210603.1 T9SS type A sorting domain-containing protein [Microvirga sp. STS02]
MKLAYYALARSLAQSSFLVRFLRFLALPGWKLWHPAGVLFAVLLLSPSAFAQNAVPPGVAPVPIPNSRPTPATNGFGIDGDLTAYFGDDASYTNAGDWLPNPLTAAGYGGVLSASGTVPATANPKRVIHKTDSYGATDDIFSGGSKIDSNPNTVVTWKTGGPNPSKNDINNALVFIEESAVATGPGTLAGDTWVMMAGDRATKEGNSFLAFQFLQKTLVRNTNGSFTSAGPDGGRTVGDIQITAEFVNGGTVPNLYYEEWRSVAGAFTWVQIQAPPAGAAFGRTNGLVLSNVPYAPFGGSSYDTNLFAEVAVDISAVYRNVQTTCVGKISTLWVVTKSSQSSSANMTDFVEPIPLDLKINVTADAGPDKAICAGGSTTIGTPAVSGYTYSWAIGNAAPFATTAQVSVSPGATTTYTLTVTKVGATCSSPPDDVVVTVNPNLTANAGTAPAAQCAVTAGNSFLLAGSGSNGTPSWAVQSNPNNLTVSIASGGTYAPTVAVRGGTGTVTLRLTVTSGAAPSCGTATSDVAVTVKPVPTASAGTAPAAQCAVEAGNSFALSGSGSNGTPAWAVQSNPNGLTVGITNGGTYAPTIAVSGGSGTVTLRLTVNGTANPLCPAATSDVAVTVNPNPTANAGTAPAAQCLSANGNSFSPSGSGSNGTPSWAVQSNPSSLTVNITNGGTYAPTVAVSGGSGTVTLRLTVTSSVNPVCTAATSDVAVTVNAKPAGPTVTIQEATLCGTLTSPTLTVCSPVVGTTYLLTESDGANPQSTTYSAGPLVFVLRAGKGFSITATASAAAGGCISAATICGGQAESCPASAGRVAAGSTATAAVLQQSIQTEAYPNPTNRDATINFSVPKSGHVVVQVYNAIGVAVATLFDGEVVGGETRSVKLKGESLATGIYTYRVVADGKTKTNHVSLVK